MRYVTQELESTGGKYLSRSQEHEEDGWKERDLTPEGCKQNKEQETFLYLLFPAEKIGKIFDQKKRCSGASQISHQLVR